MYIENFIGETIGRLGSLAVVLNQQEDHDDLLQNVLMETHEKDRRFSGFYWVNTNGEIINASNPLTDPVNVSDRSYFQQAIRTGKTQISEAHMGRVTARYVFSIATPVINHAGQIKGVLVGSIQLHVMEEIIRELVRDETIQLLDKNGQILFQTGDFPAGNHWVDSSINLEVVPWKVNSMMELDYKNSILKPFLHNLIMAFLVAHVFFMLVQSFLLKRQMARELSQNEADKLKLIGTIAASTAHEIRNPLTGIKGFISLLSRKYTDEQDQYYLSLIQTEVDRINTIVSELLIVGKPTIASKEVNHVNEILTEIIPLIESEAHLHNVQLFINLTNEPIHIMVSKDHLKQIVLNLTKNALESMESGGQLFISSGRTEEHVWVKIKDTGKGMPPEVLKNIFVPFFTMKEDGTGLGLVVCKRILDSYGGTLLLDSHEGEGTEATIQLPLVNK
ncbi:ATP-binding protein [Paenibacillus sp. PvR052]